MWGGGCRFSGINQHLLNKKQRDVQVQLLGSEKMFRAAHRKSFSPSRHALKRSCPLQRKLTATQHADHAHPGVLTSST